MTAIERYSDLKGQIAEAEAWAALIGKPYTGGVGAVTKANATLFITYKENSSSDEKQKTPESMRNELEAEIVQRSTNIITGAINRMKAKLANLATEARAEYAALMAAAGLPL